MREVAQDNINQIFSKFENYNPHPTTELKYNSIFNLLTAVVLSAQSTDKAVNKVTSDLFVICDTPEKMVNLGIKKLKEYIKFIGLHNKKAHNLIEISKILIDKYASKVPNRFNDLISLPGIGRKSANVILNTYFGHKVIAVDTHVLRVSYRIGLTQEKDPYKVEKDLLDNIPTKWIDKVSNWLVLHGRYICKSGKPNCNNCFINRYCLYFNNLTNTKSN